MPFLLEVTDQALPRNSHTQTTAIAHRVSNVIYRLKLHGPCAYQGQLCGCATRAHLQVEGPTLGLMLFYFSLEIPNTF